MIRRIKKTSGFTLIDVIIAVAIIIIGLTAVLALLRYVVLAGRLSADRFIAASLAQEGIEVVRSIRDANWLNDRDWNEELDDSGQFQVQYNSESLEAYSAQPMKIDSSGFYNYSSGDNTKFTRRIIITPNVDSSAPGENIGVISEVTWQSLGNVYSTVVEDRLYNWQY